MSKFFILTLIFQLNNKTNLLFASVSDVMITRTSTWGTLKKSHFMNRSSIPGLQQRVCPPVAPMQVAQRLRIVRTKLEIWCWTSLSFFP